MYGLSTIQHSDDVHIRISIGIACSNDVQWWNSDHWHANDVGQHMKNNCYPGGSMWNLPGIQGEIAVFSGNWRKNCDSRSGPYPDHG